MPPPDGKFARRPFNIAAVSRGPGTLTGSSSRLMTGLPGGFRQQAAIRSLTSLGLAIGERLGLPGNASIGIVDEMARTIAGEAGNQPELGQAAVGRTMFNRMDLANMDQQAFAHLGDSPLAMLHHYDVSKYHRKNAPGPNKGYKNARPGADTFSQGLHGVAAGASPYGMPGAPSAIQNATHYNTPDIKRSANWGPATRFAGHNFYSPDATLEQVARARARGVGAPAVQTPFLSPRSPNRHPRKLTPKERLVAALTEETPFRFRRNRGQGLFR